MMHVQKKLCFNIFNIGVSGGGGGNLGIAPKLFHCPVF